LVPLHSSKLTGGLTYKDRCGTIIDWNLCFNADGSSSNRAFKSGTAAFMAPILLENKPIARRTLGHDMESFFAVIIWMATLDYSSKVVFRAKPLAETLLDKKKTSKDIVHAKGYWFNTQKVFRTDIIEHFTPYYRRDSRFITCLSKLRRILYSDDSNEVDNKSEETESADLMKEDLFEMCMKEIDDYLLDKKGSDEMKWINTQALASRSRASESPEQEDEKIDSRLASDSPEEERDTTSNV
jgi:Fungal protein kinase